MRGLKWLYAYHYRFHIVSHPVRGAWIEMALNPDGVTSEDMSHPVRGAWIEIAKAWIDPQKEAVAPRQGCVD